ncbi:diaminopimelate epimerase [Paenibacillus taichungensis]|uniref:diaminopimelate epimerase n=1 Tax=Paenibacillus taichungensis TaxID=484184 RepID=UPI002DBDC645|nr:diaminopimelate epimerase [Paenibacillus taichungensis]MEC0109280.1 diaminopimelate epimerase [Paenibacillus taichungensis]MEC0196510.1 diaminopimelate epimerase [Paenibacillus taichungensis]
MKQEIDFIKFNPTQNMTVLVKTNHPAETYSHIAGQIMSYDNVYAEQVGFIGGSDKPEAAAHLEMAGGEFCGNACMALAAYIASENELKSTDFTEIILEVSGTDRLIRCQVKQQQNEYFCQVTMPIPEQIEQRTVKYEGIDMDMVIVRYREFIHIVVEVEAFDETIRKRAQALARLLGLTLGDKLIGILLYNSQSEELAPLIFVPQLDSLIWERGCGSGTASVGAYLAWSRQKEIVQHIKQPGGAIKVMAEWNGAELERITIEGSVGIVAQGKAFIDA